METKQFQLLLIKYSSLSFRLWKGAAVKVIACVWEIRMCNVHMGLPVVAPGDWESELEVAQFHIYIHTQRRSV